MAISHSRADSEFADQLARLDARLLDAHRDGEPGRLSALYTEAAELMQSVGDTDAECFYLTQAMVFALDAGLPSSEQLQARLAARGRLKSSSRIPKNDS
ncbi:MAG: hypothetical protein KTR32_05150 [Granulosicoccus sp.]|nr:hypothetical protein [Granulosicoccus sp.]